MFRDVLQLASLSGMERGVRMEVGEWLAVATERQVWYAFARPGDKRSMVLESISLAAAVL